MPLETATKISELNRNNPTNNDDVSQGDDHIRMFKGVVQDDVVPKSDGGTFDEVIKVPDGVDPEDAVNKGQLDAVVVFGDAELVLGGKLIQWARGSDAGAGPVTITFPKPFNAPPIVAVNGPEDDGGGSNVTYSFWARDITATGCVIDRMVRSGTSVGTSNGDYGWFAIGDEVPDP